MVKDIKTALQEYLEGHEGIAPILWHKKPHKKGSGEFACVRGILQSCDHLIDCNNCYSTKEGGFCLIDGQTNYGFLAVEDKHKRFVEEGKSGAYKSIKEAISDLC